MARSSLLAPIDLLRICPEGKLQKKAASIKRNANKKQRLVAIVAPYQSGKLPDVIGNTAPDAFALILLTSMIVAVAF